MTKSGAIPYAPSSRVSAVSTVITAGCCDLRAPELGLGRGDAHPRRPYRRRSCPTGAPLEQRLHDRDRPFRTASATTGSRARSSPSMFAYCEPWPVYRKATLPGAPLPRKIPRPRSAPSRRARRTASEHLQRQLRPCRPSSRSVGVVDRDPLGARAAPPLSARSAPGGGPAEPLPAPSAARSRGRRRSRPRDECAAQRRLGAGRAGLVATRRDASRDRDLGAMAVAVACVPGVVLLHHDVEVGTAEAERAHARRRADGRGRPPSRAARC